MLEKCMTKLTKLANFGVLVFIRKEKRTWSTWSRQKCKYNMAQLTQLAHFIRIINI